MKKDGSYSDNHYSITKPEVSNDSENKVVDSAQMTTMAEIAEMVFSCFDEIVDSVSERKLEICLFFLRGSTLKQGMYILYPFSYQQRKKNR